MGYNNKWFKFWNNNQKIKFQDKLNFVLLAVQQNDKQAKELLKIIDKGAK